MNFGHCNAIWRHIEIIVYFSKILHTSSVVQFRNKSSDVAIPLQCLANPVSLIVIVGTTSCLLLSPKIYKAFLYLSCLPRWIFSASNKSHCASSFPSASLWVLDELRADVSPPLYTIPCVLRPRRLALRVNLQSRPPPQCLPTGLTSSFCLGQAPGEGGLVPKLHLLQPVIASGSQTSEFSEPAAPALA